jgi:hypothetical protein
MAKEIEKNRLECYSSFHSSDVKIFEEEREITEMLLEDLVVTETDRKAD